MKRYAVIDTETTGFGKTDRILEIGIVLVDDTEIVQEWESLVNPERDISNSNIHGITSEMVSLAPTFVEVIDEISGFLDGRILVAHNAAFDKKMLATEFEKADRKIDFGIPFCTLQASGLKLEKACEKYGINNSEAHRALTDARATAMLLVQTIMPNLDLSPIKISNFNRSNVVRTLSRTAFDDKLSASQQNMRRIARNYEIHGVKGPLLSYLDAMASLLSDFKLTSDESSQLSSWARELGLSSIDIEEANKIFVKSVVEAAERDNFISPVEMQLISQISAELGMENDLSDSVMSQEIEISITSGVRVCFTGTARGQDGVEITREYLESTALARGLVPVTSVTKKSCDLLVAADKSSMSGKAKKARDFGISVISVTEYLERI